MSKPRYLESPVADDLEHKMVFVAGPRQVGKTTLARQLLDQADHQLYLNWDNRDDRKTIRDAAWPATPTRIAFDEIHKWRLWKSWIKGEYDKHGNRHQFLVTGSARLDIYRRGGDSLQGRYHHYRLHPFTCAELIHPTPNLPTPGSPLVFGTEGPSDVMQDLMAFGGFPEPFLAQSDRVLRRWQKERIDRFLREDVRDLGTVEDLSALQILADLLPERVASKLSINALRGDLEVSHRALTSWLDVLERLYFIFRLPPYSTRHVRTLKKQAKAYLWDSSMVPTQGARFENLVALHLAKFCHLLEDWEGYRCRLFYLRDRSGREVDFLVTIDQKPWFAVEAKASQTKIEPSLRYFKERLDIPFSYQIVLNSDQDFIKDDIRCLPAHRFLAALV